MQTHTLLDEAFASQRRIARFDANRGARTDTVEELIVVGDHLHTELRKQFAVEFAGQIEPAHCENDMGHAVYVDHDESPLADYCALALTRLTEATMPKAYIMVMYRSSPEPTTFAQ